MILSLIGPGDIDFHYYELLGLGKEKFQKELEKIAKALAESEVKLTLLPDRGVSFEIAKLYKKFGGKKVIGTAPVSDKRYGIKHIQKYVDDKTFDEIIDTKDWRDQNRLIALHGNAVLYLGISAGTEMELNYGTYIYKLIYGHKKGVKAQAIPGIKAGENFIYYVYSPFILNKKLGKETEAYLKKYGIKLIYVDSAEELKDKLFLF